DRGWRRPARRRSGSTSRFASTTWARGSYRRWSSGWAWTGSTGCGQVRPASRPWTRSGAPKTGWPASTRRRRENPGVAPALPRPPSVARVLHQVTATARRHGMFDPPGTVVVAVSGGPDSLCLLHSLVRLRRMFRVEPVCFHFDHRLREGSEKDAAYVHRQATRLGVPF